MKSTRYRGFFMYKEQQDKQCVQNMQNPDFLWEIPKNDPERHFVQQMQEVTRSANDSCDDTNDEKCSKKE